MSDYNIPVSGGVNGLNVPLHGHIAVYNKEFPVIPNPEGEATGYVTKLGFTPEILQIKDPEVHDWARAEEKPTYTKAEVGLGNVDNTSDLNKPISTATQTALDGKVDKAPGKALSTNDYTDTDKAIVDGVTSALATKVDKIAGKGLSTNDYTDYEKTKLAYIQSGAEVNVQADWFESNRWSDAFILNKPTKLSDFSNDTGFITSTVDNLTYYYKKSETYTQAEVNALIGSIVTISFLVVQTLPQTGEANIIYLVPADEPNPDNIYEEYIYVNNNWEMIGTTKVDLSNYYTKTQTDTLLNGKVDKEEGKGLSSNDYTDTEKALVGTIEDKLDKTETAVNSNGLVIATPVTDTAPYIYRQTPVKESFKALMKKIVGASVVWNQLVDSNTTSVTIASGHRYIAKINGTLTFGTSDGTAITVSANDYLTDLTAMFGTTIADYVYTLETSQSGSGIAWLQSYGFFTEDYYAYKQNKLESGCVSAKKIVGFNQWDEVWEVGGINATTGADQSRTDRIRSKNIYEVLNTTYFLSMSTDGVWVYRYDSNKNYLGRTNVVKNSQFTPNCSYIRFETYAEYGTTYKNDICINISDTAKNGTYEPYTETTYPISPITLRGLFKLSTDKLTVDGDEYNADGSVTRKRKRLLPSEIIANYSSFNSTTNNYSAYLYDSLNAITNSSGTDKNPSKAISNFDNCESTWNQMQSFDHANKIGVYHHPSWNYTRVYISIADTSVTTKEQAETWIRNNIEAIEYELATPTTEQTTPFTETEIVGSTEEFIDYEVAQGNRDVAIPVGTETDYYQEMKLPPLPTTSGNHNLIYNPSTGFGWS